MSKVYPGAISDTDLTIKSGILDLLNSGDSVMADRGFTIQNELTLIGVKLNIPPFLLGKTQLSGKEMVETRRIASLWIHVERAMERIKNFHVFDRALPSTFETAAEQVIFICAALSNFHPWNIFSAPLQIWKNTLNKDSFGTINTKVAPCKHI